MIIANSPKRFSQAEIAAALHFLPKPWAPARREQAADFGAGFQTVAGSLYKAKNCSERQVYGETAPDRESIDNGQCLDKKSKNAVEHREAAFCPRV